jgi:hypothetical protein
VKSILRTLAGKMERSDWDSSSYGADHLATK